MQENPSSRWDVLKSPGYFFILHAVPWRLGYPHWSILPLPSPPWAPFSHIYISLGSLGLVSVSPPALTKSAATAEIAHVEFTMNATHFGETLQLSGNLFANIAISRIDLVPKTRVFGLQSVVSRCRRHYACQKVSSCGYNESRMPPQDWYSDCDHETTLRQL